jgi:hypothetical protein
MDNATLFIVFWLKYGTETAVLFRTIKESAFLQGQIPGRPQHQTEKLRYNLAL